MAELTGPAMLRKLGKLRWLPIRHWFDLRRAMHLKVRVRDPADGHWYTFVADSLHSYQRARAHLSKEPETIAWLRKNLRPGDVFLDVGANVGTFSLFAAKHISDEGHVYACEPHLPTAVQLLQNVAANALEQRLSVMSVAASGEDGFLPFRYKRWREGASGSQLTVAHGPVLNAAVGVELKSGLRIDTMIAQGTIRPPNLVKIDTDGLELQILSGMQALLRSEQRPRSILVEVQTGQSAAQVELMNTCGYAMVAAHVLHASDGRSAGADEQPFNAVFEPENNSERSG